MPSAAHKKILIAPANLVDEAHEGVLHRAALQVLRVPEGGDVAAAAAEFDPDLVVLSNRMPIEELSASFAMRGKGRRAKVLVLLEELGAADLTHHPSIDGHLVCPVAPEALGQSVAALLDATARGAPRVEVDLLASVVGVAEDGPDAKAYGQILNISCTGLRIESQLYLTVGATGTVEFHLPGVPERFSLRCTVRGLLDDTLLHYGMQFSDVPPEAELLLQDFVLRELAHGGGATRGQT